MFSQPTPVFKINALRLFRTGKAKEYFDIQDIFPESVHSNENARIAEKLHI